MVEQHCPTECLVVSVMSVTMEMSQKTASCQKKILPEEVLW